MGAQKSCRVFARVWLLRKRNRILKINQQDIGTAE
jgi:hypothetical protein